MKYLEILRFFKFFACFVVLTGCGGSSEENENNKVVIKQNGLTIKIDKESQSLEDFWVGGNNSAAFNLEFSGDALALRVDNHPSWLAYEVVETGDRKAKVIFSVYKAEGSYQEYENTSLGNHTVPITFYTGEQNGNVAEASANLYVNLKDAVGIVISGKFNNDSCYDEQEVCQEQKSVTHQNSVDMLFHAKAKLCNGAPEVGTEFDATIWQRTFNKSLDIEHDLNWLKVDEISGLGFFDLGVDGLLTDLSPSSELYNGKVKLLADGEVHKEINLAVKVDIATNVNEVELRDFHFDIQGVDGTDKKDFSLSVQHDFCENPFSNYKVRLLSDNLNMLSSEKDFVFFGQPLPLVARASDKSTIGDCPGCKYGGTFKLELFNDSTGFSQIVNANYSYLVHE